MAAAAGLRALGAKGSGWLRRGPWAPLTTGFCSGGPAGIGRPEPGPRPTIARQQDGIRSAARLGAGLFPGGWPAGPRKREGRRRLAANRATHAESRAAPSVVSSARRRVQFIYRSPSVRRSVRREKNPRMRRLQRSLAWAQWPLGPCRIHTEDLSGAACDGASTAPKPQSESTSHLDSAWAALWEAPPLLCL